MPKRIYILLILLLPLSLGLFAQKNKQVLLISSYNSRFPTYFQQIAGIKSVLDTTKIKLDIEFMDSKRFMDDHTQKLFYELLRHKLKNNTPYDAILTADDDALNFVLAHEEELFKNIPTVFLGVNNIEKALKQNYNPNVSGVVESVSMQETIELMLQLFPESSAIYCITDSTSSGLADLMLYRQISKQMPTIKFKEINLSQLSFSEYEHQLSKLTSRTPVLLLSAYQDKLNHTFDFKQTMSILHEHLHAPLFHLWEHGMGDGIIGGKIISHYEQGKTAAEIVYSLLCQQPISSIQVITQSPNVFMFDYNELLKYDISMQTLPKQALIVNKPFSFWEKYKQQIFILLSILIALIVLIFILSANILKRRKIEKQLKNRNTDILNLNHDLVSSKHKAEEEKKKFKQLFYEHTAAKLLICPDSGQIYDANPAATKFYGWNLEEFKKLNINSLNTLSATDVKKKMDIAKKNGKVHFEFKHRKSNGNVVDVEVYSSKVIIAGKPYLYSIIHDISARKEAQEALIIAKEKAQESDRLKSAFLANMSHEIRTPMNGILGFADLLKKPGLKSENQQKYVSIILKSGKRMLSIINDIVDISKIEAGLMTFKLSETNINEQIEYTYTFFKPEADAKGIELTYSTPLPQNEAILKTDREKVYAILTNLVKNAIKYTYEGSIEIGYHKISKNNKDELEFYVKDTGIGIPLSRQKAIFERFIQADIEDKMANQGAGLGLAITKAYVEKLGGKIWVKSTENQGSAFYFTLPFQNKPTHHIVEQRTVNTKTIKPLKVLIADDDEFSEMLLDEITAKFSKTTLKAKTGVETVEICRNNPDIDLILMDIQMPELGGYEATKQIRSFNKKVTIIAQTAFALSGDKEKAMAAGCNDYIAKPIKKELLQNLLEKYFGQ